MSFEKLVEISEQMTKANAGTLESRWKTIGDNAETTISDFATELMKTLDSGWTGNAASSAIDTINEYGKNSDGVSDQFQGVSGTLASVSAAVDAVKNTYTGIPEYISKGGMYNTLTPWSTDDEHAYYERHAQALEAVNRYGVQLSFAEQPVPAFPEVKADTGSRPGANGGGGGGGGSYGGGGGGGGGGGTQGDSEVDPDGLGESGESQLGDVGESDSATSSSAPTSSSLDEDALSTQAMSANAPTTSAAGMGLDSARGGGGGGGVGSGGGIGGGAGLTGATPNGIVGAPGGAAGAGGAAAGAGAGATRGGGMGGGMMGAGGGRGGGGNDDKEHKTASYLINLNNGNELIGKLPPASPPVIGA